MGEPNGFQSLALRQIKYIAQRVLSDFRNGCGRTRAFVIPKK